MMNFVVTDIIAQLVIGFVCCIVLFLIWKIGHKNVKF